MNSSLFSAHVQALGHPRLGNVVAFFAPSSIPALNIHLIMVISSIIWLWFFCQSTEGTSHKITVNSCELVFYYAFIVAENSDAKIGQRPQSP